MTTGMVLGGDSESKDKSDMAGEAATCSAAGLHYGIFRPSAG